MIFSWKVAWRFLKDGKQQTLFILVGIAIGVAVQIFLSSLIAGLQRDLINQTVGDAPHIYIKRKALDLSEGIGIDQPVAKREISTTQIPEKNLGNWEMLREAMDKIPGVKHTAAVVSGSGFAGKGEKQMPILMKGMLLTEADGIYKITDRIIAGRAQLMGNEILIGKSIAEELLIAPGSIIRMSNAAGNQEIFTVNGIFDLGNEGINKTWIVMERRRAQRFLGYNGEITALEMQIDDVFQASAMAQQIGKIYENVDAESWQEINKQLLAALKSQSSSSTIIQVFVLLAVALGISSVLAVSVMQKSRQIGILKAMGADDQTTANIFLLQGGMLGLLGSLLGSGIAIGLIKVFVLSVASGNGTLFPIALEQKTFILSIGIATIVGILSAWVPAIRTRRLNTIEVIRNG